VRSNSTLLAQRLLQLLHLVSRLALKQNSHVNSTLHNATHNFPSLPLGLHLYTSSCAAWRLHINPFCVTPCQPLFITQSFDDSTLPTAWPSTSISASAGAIDRRRRRQERRHQERQWQHRQQRQIFITIKKLITVAFSSGKILARALAGPMYGHLRFSLLRRPKTHSMFEHLRFELLSRLNIRPMFMHLRFRLSSRLNIQPMFEHLRFGLIILASAKLKKTYFFLPSVFTVPPV